MRVMPIHNEHPHLVSADPVLGFIDRYRIRQAIGRGRKKTKRIGIQIRPCPPSPSPRLRLKTSISPWEHVASEYARSDGNVSEKLGRYIFEISSRRRTRFYVSDYGAQVGLSRDVGAMLASKRRSSCRGKSFDRGSGYMTFAYRSLGCRTATTEPGSTHKLHESHHHHGRTRRPLGGVRL